MLHQEQQLIELRRQHEHQTQALNSDRDDLIARFKAELEALRDEIAAIQRDRDERLLLAENDKQQVGGCT